MSMEQVLPQGWAQTTLGQVTEVNPRVDLTAVPEDTPVSFVRMAAVEEESGRVDVSQVRPLSEVRRGYTVFQDGDVLFAKITPCMENGKSAVVRELSFGIGFGSTEFHVLRPREGVDAYLLRYFLAQKSYRDAARSSMTGTAGQLRVPAAYLSSTPFPLPPLAEQRRIVAAIEEQFTRLDAGVAAVKRAQATLKRYRAAVLKAAVEGKLTASWRLQHPDVQPASELLADILAERRARWEADLRAKGKDPAKAKYDEPQSPKTEELPELPQGWVWATLDQVSLLQRGRFSIRPRNDPRYYGGAFPFLQIGDLPQDGGEIRGYRQTLNDAGYQVSREFPAGTVLISIAASIGATGILTFAACFPDSIVGATCALLTTARYVEMLLRVNRHELQANAYASGGQPNISLPVLASVLVPFPPVDEQEQVVAEVEQRLSVVSALEATIAANLKRAERLRQAILERAFTGRLVPQNPADEPASALLERVWQEREDRRASGRAAVVETSPTLWAQSKAYGNP